MAVQQGVQLVGELGGGIGGVVLTIQVAKQSKGAPSNKSGGGQGPTGGGGSKK
jgi:hypothetical protein